MNIFNRFILVLLLLGLILILTVVLIFPDQILTTVGQFLVDWGQYFAWIDQQQGIIRLAMSIGIAVIVDLILALLIYWEIKPKRKRFIKVEQVSGGKATVSLESIVNQLLYRLDALPGVVKVTPAVSPKGDRIQVRLDVTITRDLAIPQMANHLITTAKQAIGDDLGLVIFDEPQIRIKVVEGVRRIPSPQVTAQQEAKVATPTLPPKSPAETKLRLISPLSSDSETQKEKDDWA
jgi:hypothetical protein